MSKPGELHLKDIALGMLARREHAVAELTRKLTDKVRDKSEQVAVDLQRIGPLVQELVDKNFINDRRYAAARARHRADISKWGAQRIKQELSRNGVGEDDIAYAMASLEEEGLIFAETAKRAAARKFRKPLPPGEDAMAEQVGAGGFEARQELRQARQKERQRRVAYLVRRGYTFAEASQAVDAADDGADA